MSVATLTEEQTEAQVPVQTSESRQVGFIPPDLPAVTIIGAGMGGSWMTHSLARLGCPITIYDDDVVAVENLSSQAFVAQDVGYQKTMALARSFDQVIGLRVRWEGQRIETPVVIVAPDNMDTRQRAAKAFTAEWGEHVQLLLDCRSASDTLLVYTVLKPSPDNILEPVGDPRQDRLDTYRESHLPNDDEVEPVACGFNGAAYIGMRSAYEVTRRVVAYAREPVLGGPAVIDLFPLVETICASVPMEGGDALVEEWCGHCLTNHKPPLHTSDDD